MSDTHRLTVFLVAAETLNFSEAARQLDMTQPSVSQHIQALEQKFDQPLFYRYGRYVELTDGGKRLATLARDMMDRWVRMEEEMETLKGEVAGHLVVGCSTTPGKYILPPLLAHFHRSFPKVSITCHVASQERCLQMLCDGDVHFAFASTPHICHSDIEFRRFTIDPVQLIAPLGHPWALQGEVKPEELCDSDFIMREEASGTRAAVREALDSVGVRENQLPTFLTLGNSEAIAIAVQEGLGVAFVSQFVVARLVAGRVATVRVRGLDIQRDIFFGRHTRRPGTAAQSAFWQYVWDRVQVTPVTEGTADWNGPRQQE
jgi:DNA-binding transcriptional LysR family regulator